MPGENWTIISVDDHVLEPPDTWRNRLPAKHREGGPHLVRDDQGEAWVYESRRMPTVGLEVAAALDWPPDTFQWDPVPYAEMPPGAHDPLARVGDMDRDGVLASVLFPSQFTGFCGSAFFQGSDRELALLCVQAWNDFMLDEWCGAAPGRFIPQIILPLWDVPACVHEIERNAAKGARSIAFCENPSRHGFPSIFSSERHWDPVFAAAQATGMLLNMHIGSSSFIPITAGDAPLSVMIGIASFNAFYSFADWLLSDNLERFPDLKITWAEGGIGWIPSILDRLDFVWERHRWLPSRLEEPPSHYYRRQAFGCCYADEVAHADLERIGLDHVLLEVDYPHSDSTFPHTPEATKRGLACLSNDEILQVSRGNAERLFRFTPTGIGER